MQFPKYVLPILCCLISSPCQAGQSAPASSPQAVTLFQQSLAALSGRTSITDVTLSGTARRIAGSDDESGTAVLKAIATGASSVNLSLPSGTRSETRNCSAIPPAGSWSGPDGVSHAIAFHNLLTGPAWFFPAFPISSGISAGYIATYIGHETRNGQAVEHLTVSQAPTTAAPPGAPSFGRLSQVDFLLDSSTFLPVAITFNVHPDNNALVDIPVEIDFSNYTVVNGVHLPFHIQKFINNSLVLDLQFDSAVFNSGLPQATFTVGAGL